MVTMPYTLVLASTSDSRKMLLRNASIPFTFLALNVDEKKCDWGLPLTQLVTAIARYKMDHAILPDGTLGDTVFVLTADTLSQDALGIISGKPSSHEDAIRMLRSARDGMITCTGFCLEKRLYTRDGWQTVGIILEHVQAHYIFDVPEEWLSWYMQTSRGLTCAGALAVEEHGALFLRSLHGSYSAVVGLPLYEVRLALHKLGFFA